ncbi:MAG: protein-disulfide reductase DsbD domain-containing protein [Prevotella sp.]
MKKHIIIFTLCLFAAASFAAVKKANLRVLFVGGNIDKTGQGIAQRGVDEKFETVAERNASFADLLNQYFTTVKAVEAKDYTAEMSKQYDVTVFDAAPKAIRERKTETDITGRFLTMQPAQYLPADYDCATLCIGAASESLGRSLGVKNDWYCLCLDADAHHLVKNHAIFKGPFKTKITMFDAPTPEDAFHYTYFYDAPLPPTTPRWKVQTKGYESDKGFPVGMVSRPWGYVESSESEYISSGVCAKTIDAVAIGRHANFLHWGFAASPRYMTDEAKVVFANAVVYISKFNGKKPIARKYNDRIATKEDVKEKRGLASHAVWEETVAQEKKMYDEFLAQKKAIEQKKQRGETLTEEEKQTLAYEVEPNFTTYEQRLKKYQGDLYAQFGSDEQKYMDYYDQNLDYFTTNPDESYDLHIDEDAKRLGISVDSKQLIDKAITLWETSEDVATAKRILYRYTLLRYDNAKQWRDWYKKYEKQLFFSEAGGWYWLVDNGDPTTPGNDYSVALKEKRERIEAQKRKVEQSLATDATTDDQPVAASAIVQEYWSSQKDLTIKVSIKDGYHIYGNVSSSDPYLPTEIKVELSNGYTFVGNMKNPKVKALNSTGTTIYEGDVMFQQRIDGSGRGKAKVTISYQCCDDHICFPPQDIVLNVEI